MCEILKVQSLHDFGLHVVCASRRGRVVVAGSASRTNTSLVSINIRTHSHHQVDATNQTGVSFSVFVMYVDIIVRYFTVLHGLSFSVLVVLTCHKSLLSQILYDKQKQSIGSKRKLVFYGTWFGENT